MPELQIRPQSTGIGFAPFASRLLKQFQVYSARNAYAHNKRGMPVNVEIVFRLENRRKSVERTLEHPRQQQDEVDRNTEWKDLCAQRRRSELLAELLGWYDGRLKRIDSLLNHVIAKRSRQ